MNVLLLLTMKKSRLFPLLFLLPFLLFGQEDLEKKVSDLRLKISHAEPGVKLKMMDSLTKIIEFNENYGYTELTNETIALALEQNDLNIATRLTGDLIFYNTTVLGNPEKGLAIFNAFKGKEKEFSDNTAAAAANLYAYGGNSYFRLGQFDDALRIYDIAYQYAVQAKNENRRGYVLLRKGNVLVAKGVFAGASQHLQEAVSIFSASKDTSNIIGAKNSLSILYSQNQFYKEAQKEREEAIALANNDPTTLGPIYYNIGADYREQGNNVLWIHYLKKSYEENERSAYKETFKSDILCNLVIAYSISDSLQKAEKYLKEIEANKQQYATGNNRDFYIEALKQYAFARTEYPKALQYGKEHLALKQAEESFVELYNAENFLAETYLALKDSSKYYVHKNKYYQIKDSISNAQNVRSLTYYQTLYETEKRDATIRSQTQDIALLNAKSRIKNQLLLFGSLGLLSIFGMILLVLSRNAAKKRQLLQEGFSQNLIQSQEEERIRISRDLHDSIGQQLVLIKRKAQKKNPEELAALATHALEDMRLITRDLYPVILEKSGLTQAIQDMIHTMDAESDLFFTTQIDPIDGIFTKDQELHLYRFIQESLNNIWKHAQASAVTVNMLKKKKHIAVLIKDNGKGFDLKHKMEASENLGLKTLYERTKILKATLHIESVLHKGTSLKTTISYD